MEWFGIAALLLLLYYSSYLRKIKHLEMKVKQLEKKQRGATYMSKLINSLVAVSYTHLFCEENAV